MNPSCIVVIGASAGGVTALKEVVASIPDGFSGAVFVVSHLSPHARSHLPEILSSQGPLKARHPQDDEEIVGGQIYVALPDYHLLVDGQRICLRKGPKENRFRPSIDALFRSAAYTYRSRVIGVILSGALDDGTSGLWAVKRMGGTSIVQSPAEARFDSMPLNALSQVDIDHCVTAAQMGPLLADLARAQSEKPPAATEAERKQLGIEVKIASSANAFQEGIMDVGELTPFTCPECHGALVQLTEGRLEKFRCHTGHAYSASALLAGVTATVGENLWQVTRALEECVMLLDHSGNHFEEVGQTDLAARFFKKAREIERRATVLQTTTLEHEHLSEDLLTTT